jgi:hypothetical protein
MTLPVLMVLIEVGDARIITSFPGSQSASTQCSGTLQKIESRSFLVQASCGKDKLKLGVNAYVLSRLISTCFLVEQRVKRVEVKSRCGC